MRITHDVFDSRILLPGLEKNQLTGEQLIINKYTKFREIPFFSIKCIIFNPLGCYGCCHVSRSSDYFLNRVFEKGENINPPC